MNNHRLATTKEEKDLAVMINNNLKSDVNCQAVYKKANRVLVMILRTISYKSTEILHGLYITAKTRSCWKKKQHRFTKMIPGLKYLD